jgi:hypothetical protein
MSTPQLRAFLATETQTKKRTVVRSGVFSDVNNKTTYSYSNSEFPLKGKRESNPD